MMAFLVVDPAKRYLFMCQLCFKHFREYCIIGSMPGVCATAELRNQVTAFLHFCRVEKGLSENSLQAYSTDLSKFVGFVEAQGGPDRAGAPDVDGLRAYLDHLQQSGLSNRSVARHLTTLRNFYGHLLREGAIATIRPLIYARRGSGRPFLNF